MNYLKIVLLILTFATLSYSQKTITTQFVGDINNIDMQAKWDSLPALYFTQLEPDKDNTSSYSSKMWIVYDERNLYFFMRCYQKKNTIVARVQLRDNLNKSDDGVVLLLDTYNDKRSGFGFYINPLGTLADFRVTDDGRTIDKNWDAEWKGESKTYDWGWEVKLIIPFSSLKYKQDSNEWGFNVSRIVRSNFESSWWSGPMNNDYRLSQSGLLSGISAPERKSAISFFPYTTLRMETDDHKKIKEDFSADAGVDLRLQIQTNLQANLTYNPDFATVEGDRERINLSRYELSYPEKRLFFQEGNDMFRTRIRTFYSRRIGDIDYGGKLTGKIGKYNMNLLSVKSSEDSEIDTLGAVYSALRLKRDILKSSSLGMTFVDKSWENGYSRSLSMDYVLNLGSAWKLTGQFVGSASSDWKNSAAYFMRFARESNIYHYHVRYSNFGENFKDNVNQTGYVIDDDRHEFDMNISYKWWMSKESSIQYINVSTNDNAFWSHSGTLRSWYLSQSGRIYMKNRLSLDVSYGDEFKLFEKKYYNHKIGLTAGYNTDEWSSLKIGYQQGINFDRDFYLISGSASAKITKELAIEYSYIHTDFKPDTSNKSTNIHVVSANYYITPDLWFRLFAQSRSNIDLVYIYGLFGWRFKPPFGAVYLIYSKDDRLYFPEEMKYKTNVLFFKFTYPIDF